MYRERYMCVYGYIYTCILLYMRIHTYIYIYILYTIYYIQKRTRAPVGVPLQDQATARRRHLCSKLYYTILYHTILYYTII